MPDNFLSWLVSVVVVAFGFLAIVVPSKRDDAKSHMRWLRILGGLLILYAALAWWQQSRSDRAAKKDRDDAVQQTIATVTKVVSDQDQEIIENDTDQIATLKSQLAVQGGNVKAVLHNQVEEHGASVAQAQKREAIRDRLFMFWNDGRSILGACREVSPPGLGGSDVGSCAGKATDWTTKVRNYLSSNLDKGYQARFESAPPETVNIDSRITEQFRTDFSVFRGRVDILLDFLKDLPN